MCCSSTDRELTVKGQHIALLALPGLGHGELPLALVQLSPLAALHGHKLASSAPRVVVWGTLQARREQGEPEPHEVKATEVSRS